MAVTQAQRVARSSALRRSLIAARLFHASRDAQLLGLAAAGSVVMAASSWRVGGLPVGWGPEFPVIASIVFYTGLLVLSIAWLLLGRRVLAGSVAVSAPRRFALAASAPFAFAVPMGRDLWSYAAQGHLVSVGLDPYRAGPDAAPGAFARQVSPRWADTPSPYGPVWLRLSQAAAWVSHDHPLIAVLLLRLPAFAGLALCGWAVPVLVRRFTQDDSRLARCLWLGLASPLVVVLGIGGGHNDLFMLGLALAGLAVATRPGPWSLAAGAGLDALAVLVKSPAVVVLAFAVPVWLHASPARVTGRRVATAVVTTVVSGGAVLAAVTAACGLGSGWTRTVRADTTWVSWLSLPSGLTMLGKFIAGSAAPRGLDDTLRTARSVGEVVAVVALVALWLAAVRRPPRSLAMLTIALAASAVLAPSVQPWYYLWGLMLVGLVVSRRGPVLAAALVALVFPIMITPSGFGLEGTWAALVVLAFAAAMVATFLARSAADAVAAEQRAVVLEQTGKC